MRNERAKFPKGDEGMVRALEKATSQNRATSEVRNSAVGRGDFSLLKSFF
jgi:hypothetical protein